MLKKLFPKRNEALETEWKILKRQLLVFITFFTEEKQYEKIVVAVDKFIAEVEDIL